jgi:hypothetical protein
MAVGSAPGYPLCCGDEIVDSGKQRLRLLGEVLQLEDLALRVQALMAVHGAHRTRLTSGVTLFWRHRSDLGLLRKGHLTFAFPASLRPSSVSSARKSPFGLPLELLESGIQRC